MVKKGSERNLISTDKPIFDSQDGKVSGIIERC
jgi:hypothetical protein